MSGQLEYSENSNQPHNAQKDNALRLQQELSRNFSPVLVEVYKSHDGKLFRVLVGRFKDEQEALQTRNALKKIDLSGLMVRLER